MERIANILKQHNIRFGFGGMARIGYGTLPAEMILTEHYRLGSQMAILSRGFCDANLVENPESVRGDFVTGVARIREKEKEILTYSAEQFENNTATVCRKVAEIVDNIKKKSEN